MNNTKPGAETTSDLVADLAFGAVSFVGPDYERRVREHVELTTDRHLTSLDAGQCLALAAALNEAARHLLLNGSVAP